MTTVAVTGADSPLGAAVLARLAADRRVDAVLAIDCDEPQMPPGKVEFRTGDIRDPLLSVALTGADVVVNLALTSAPIATEDTMFAVNVHGTRNLLAAADRVGIRRLVHLSSATVYGAHPDNPVPLTEDEPLRANPGFSWAYHHRLAEELVAEWSSAHPDAVVTVLRPVTTLGPGTDTFVTRHLEQPVLPVVRALAPPAQFVHTEDVAEAVVLAATAGLGGAYNVGADGWLSAGEISAVLGKRLVEVPEVVAFSAAERMWGRGVLPAPAGALHYLMHPWVVSTERLRAAGWKPTYTNREVLREFSVEHRPYVSVGRARVPRRALEAGTLVGLLAALGLLAGLFGRLRKRRRRRD